MAGRIRRELAQVVVPVDGRVGDALVVRQNLHSVSSRSCGFRGRRVVGRLGTVQLSASLTEGVPGSLLELDLWCQLPGHSVADVWASSLDAPATDRTPSGSAGSTCARMRSANARSTAAAVAASAYSRASA